MQLWPLLPLLPAVAVFWATRRVESAYPGGAPSRSYLATLALWRWLVFLSCWLAGLVALLAVFLTLMLTVQRKEGVLFTRCLTGILGMFSTANCACHLASFLAPLVLLACVAPFQEPSSDETATRGQVRYLLTLMAVAFLLVLVACPLVAGNSL